MTKLLIDTKFLFNLRTCNMWVSDGVSWIFSMPTTVTKKHSTMKTFQLLGQEHM